MTPIEKLDLVLNNIASSNTANEPTLAEVVFLRLGTSEVDAAEFFRLMKKLEKDGYIHCQIDFQQGHGNNEDLKTYFSISEEGFEFYILGGYTTQNIERVTLEYNRSEDRQIARRMYWLTVVLAFGTSVAALYYGLEALKILSHYWHWVASLKMWAFGKSF